MKSRNPLLPLLAAFVMLAIGSAPALGQRQATATATVANGLLVAIAVTDPGEGYVNPPSVSIVGGGGSGATATAFLSWVGVGFITVTAAGSGYTNVPEVVIGAPDQAVVETSVLLMEMIPRLTIYGDVGVTNQIQWVNAFGDTNAWTVLTNIVLPSSPYVFYDTLLPVGGQRFYRAVVGGGGVRPAAPAGYVWVPPGRFTMGSPDTEEGRFINEGPQTVVTLTRAFFMGAHEVTQAEYQAVAGSNPAYFGGNLNRPVERVTWQDAHNYCAWLTTQERNAGRLPVGWAYRLPTEAEWEYAARAGKSTRFSWGDDPHYSLTGDYVWSSVNSSWITHGVEEKRPNKWGLYDMSGNVMEWCSDWYGDYPGGTLIDPQGPTTGTSRVRRGGAWNDGGSYFRSAYRSSAFPAIQSSGLGFRAVLAPVR